jgi:uncharacterized protein (DUF488 family)
MMAVIMGSAPRRKQSDSRPGGEKKDRQAGSARGQLYSIGHSNHEFGMLVELLRAAGVTAVADVRSMPFSQRYPQFNRPEMEWGLKQQGIEYVFLGNVLGGRPQGSGLYDGEGRVDYGRVRGTAAFREGLERLDRALGRFTVVMLCAEEDPLDCHRGLMITPALAERGIRPGHLRGDGRVETTEEMEQRLLTITGLGTGIVDGLFADVITDQERREMLAEAYRSQARRKAFRVRPGDTPPLWPEAEEGEAED